MQVVGARAVRRVASMTAGHQRMDAEIEEADDAAGE
jgi:hypothetical protein